MSFGKILNLIYNRKGLEEQGLSLTRSCAAYGSTRLPTENFFPTGYKFLHRCIWGRIDNLYTLPSTFLTQRFQPFELFLFFALKRKEVEKCQAGKVYW